MTSQIRVELRGKFNVISFGIFFCCSHAEICRRRREMRSNKCISFKKKTFFMFPCSGVCEARAQWRRVNLCAYTSDGGLVNMFVMNEFYNPRSLNSNLLNRKIELHPSHSFNLSSTHPTTANFHSLPQICSSTLLTIKNHLFHFQEFISGFHFIDSFRSIKSHGRANSRREHFIQL